jgi:hypothetical protein
MLEDSPMRRSAIGLLVTVALSLLMAPLVTDAQRVGKGVRLGVLSARLPRAASNWVAFEQRLRALGYAEQTAPKDPLRWCGIKSTVPEM